MPITLQALLAPNRLAVQFAVKTLLGGGLALWLVQLGATAIMAKLAMGTLQFGG